jgi:hypothetical protein
VPHSMHCTMSEMQTCLMAGRAVLRDGGRTTRSSQEQRHREVKQPLYVTIIREPLARIMSEFFWCVVLVQWLHAQGSGQGEGSGSRRTQRPKRGWSSECLREERAHALAADAVATLCCWRPKPKRLSTAYCARREPQGARS